MRELMDNIGDGGLIHELARAGKTIVFYCAFGERSAMAVQAAQDKGLSSARHIEGGIAAWKERAARPDRRQRRRLSVRRSGVTVEVEFAIVADREAPLARGVRLSGRDHHEVRPGRDRGLASGGRILEDETIGRREAEAARAEEKTVGRGLADPDLVAGDDRRRNRQARGAEPRPGERRRRRGDDGPAAFGDRGEEGGRARDRPDAVDVLDLIALDEPRLGLGSRPATARRRMVSAARRPCRVE